MKIRRASVWLFERRLDGHAWNPAFRWTRRHAPLLVLELEDGVRGIGEAWSRYTDAATVLKALDAVAAHLAGRVLDHPSEVWEQGVLDGRAQADWAGAAAWSAADMALWDAFARGRGEPLWRALGGCHAQAPVYASGGLYRDDYGLDGLRDEARGYREQGFGAMKMKIAGIPRELDLLRVAAVREGLGAQAGLWVDAVNQLSVQGALDFWRALRPFDVSAMQSPLPPEDVEGLRRLNGSGLPVIVSEAEYRHDEFLRLLDAGAASLLQFCLTLCGGFTGGLRLDGWAADRAIPSTPQCFSTSIAQAATLHFAAARPNVVSAEFHGFHDHLRGLYLPGTACIDDGFACAGTAPGLGVAIPEPGRQREGSIIRRVSEARA
ncbi:mandelate racemase/muconate lactonizing enzyme family protein [Castellaniella sp. GW247-6E4]|uniref:mandelate racemase/muconate lactonizing enzyme family protein n=1 Tax=Castellaniella sp. GW247-6E4 TaxID=3140380 RepID=UPI0033150D53